VGADQGRDPAHLAHANLQRGNRDVLLFFQRQPDFLRILPGA
jgi:hypothetical protein